MVLEIPPADTGTIVGSVDDCWQTAIDDVGPAGADKGEGGRYLVLPPDHLGRCPRRLHRIAVADISVLCAAALELSQRSRRRHRRRGGVRETRSGLSALGGGRPATDHIHRRDRRLVRRDHPLRRAVFRCAEPHRADRAVADPRQGDGRLTQDDRHREGQAVHPERQGTPDLGGSRARSARLADKPLEDIVFPAGVLRGRPLARAGLRRGRQGNDDELRGSRTGTPSTIAP